MPRARARRLAPENRRQQLLDCAVRVFARRGIGRAGHAEIAREADVAVSTVFSYFRTRSDLVRGVLEEIAAYYQAMTERHHRSEIPPTRALLDLAVAFIASVDERRDHASVLLEWSTSIRDEIWPLYLGFYDDIVRRIASTLRRGQEDGTIERDLDVENSAALFVSSAFLIIQMKLAATPPERIQRLQMTILRATIGARALELALR